MLDLHFDDLNVITVEQQNQHDDEDERGRRVGNIVLLVAGVLVVGGGIWLVNALVDARKSALCFESGRRDCNRIILPDRTRD